MNNLRARVWANELGDTCAERETQAHRIQENGHPDPSKPSLLQVGVGLGGRGVRVIILIMRTTILIIRPIKMI